MPYIGIESGKLTETQKKELVSELTAVASRIMHVPEEFFTVVIREVPDVNFGIGGKTIELIKKEYQRES